MREAVAGAGVTSSAAPPNGAGAGSAGAGAIRRPRFALATISLVLLLTFLDNTIVAVVLAPIQESLHAGIGALQWIVNGYALTFASLMLTFGMVGDLFGRKKVMLGGVAVFCGGSVLCALAPDPGVLIAGRVVMGVGAAASEPGTLSMIRHLYTGPAERARALGVWAAVSGLALAFGPTIGGALAGLWSWRAVFWFNLVFGLVALVAAALVLPENADPGNRRIDVGGAVLAAVSLASLSFAIIAGETAGYRTWWIDALFAASALGAVAFALFERRADNPVLDIRFFRKPPFAGSNVVAFAIYFGTFAIFFFVALYLQVIVAISPYAAALDFLPMAAGMVVAGLLTGRWVARSGPRIPMAAGCLLAAVGIWLTDAGLNPSVGISTLGWTLTLAGVGFGMAVVPVTSAALAAIPARRSGMAASATNTSRELGAVVGVAVLGSVVNGQLTVNLIRHLAAIGIPAQFRNAVAAAVTTGTFNSKAAGLTKAAKNSSLIAVVNRVIQAAYAAFSHGLRLSLIIAGALMLVCVVVALVTMRGTRSMAGALEGPED